MKEVRKYAKVYFSVAVCACLVFCLNSIRAQDDAMLNQLDEQGRKQGAWKQYDDFGKLKFQGQFVDDKPIGTFEYFYESGARKAISEFSNQGQNSYTLMYAENGTRIAEGHYVDQKKEGVWKFFDDLDGQLISEEYYENGLLSGKVLNYYTENGKLAEEITYKAGKRNGPNIKYFTDGSAMMEAHYLNDELEGVFKTYYPNGQLNIEGSYELGVRVGTWKTYDEEGKLLEEELY